ncbi:cupin domain-containing protein [Nocardia otitidiscaviarum]|uniref:cupin domain-containing protein n=1 Tax=Nocardia otitidiscaviarum TaxID=1823 RepID=UPI0018943B2B|nr:cupin domain-containing protein [Nocardia otitidiscaviarum]MBF6178269.1 AraC family ligand binding domain-containing protein [Nocardia otitidiscaviarum]
MDGTQPEDAIGPRHDLDRGLAHAVRGGQHRPRLHQQPLPRPGEPHMPGRPEFYLDGRSTIVTAGSLVVVPPGMPHAFGAVPDSTADVLIVLGPGVDRFEYFRQLGRIQNGRADFASLLPEQQRFDVHFLPGVNWRQG